MIVLGSRGLDVVRRALIGSVSDYVIRQSAVPVLICPSIQKKTVSPLSHRSTD